MAHWSFPLILTIAVPEYGKRRGTLDQNQIQRGNGYSRGLVPMSDGHTLFVISGGPLGTDRANSVTYGIVDLRGGISDGTVTPAK